MKKLATFFDWCTTPITATPKQWTFYRLPVVIFVIDAFLSLTAATLLSSSDLLEEVEPLGVPILSFDFMVALVIISAIEELLFRIIPLSIAMSATSRRTIHLLTAIIAGALFGYVHGGFANIPVQGVGGFLYGVLFIKYARIGEDFLTASIVVITMHTVWNGMIGVLLLLSGETMF